jgi:hypothetical protein
MITRTLNGFILISGLTEAADESTGPTCLQPFDAMKRMETVNTNKLLLNILLILLISAFNFIFKIKFL